MTESIPIRVQHKRMTASQWRVSSVVLLDGEIGVESDTGYAKVGNGSSLFRDLVYMRGPKGDNITVAGSQQMSDGRIRVNFSDGNYILVPKGNKGDKGDNITLVDYTVESDGRTKLTFSDGSTAYIPKGEKGDKGDPLRYEDLTDEQIAAIKGKDIDLSVYATKAELQAIDVSGQLTDYQKTTDADDKYATKEAVENISLTPGAAGSRIYTSTNNPEARAGIDYFLDNRGRIGVVSEVTGGVITKFSNLITLKGEKGDTGDTGEVGLPGAKGDPGEDGQPGSTIHVVSSTPAYSLGRVGDIALNSSNWNVYRKSGTSTWTLVGNIKGATGATGARGTNGTNGTSITAQVVTFAPSQQAENTLYLVKG